ncbi:MAG: hypothetical protein A3E84_04475 [Gammaproteobacteria bacterium RIFCSPHIGHO2_12_FULL_42_13]|nr:MAG: hypothetical protein A3E84_04475 [Gammaproteobacteria bacterium RIFCSPHIGHO2_12_FULL_42_13]
MSAIHWQCRRGMLELDVILERFLTYRYPQLSPKLQHDFTQLLALEDPVLFDWLVADVPCEYPQFSTIVKEIRARAWGK